MSVARILTDLTGITAFPPTAQVVVPFDPQKTSILNEETGVADIFVSFDGKTDDFRLAAGTGTTFIRQGRQVWLRRDGAGGAPTRVAVVAES